MKFLVPLLCKMPSSTKMSFFNVFLLFADSRNEPLHHNLKWGSADYLLTRSFSMTEKLKMHRRPSKSLQITKVNDSFIINKETI